jgi:hypothetical protein
MINMWQHNKYVAKVLNQSINVISGTHHLLLPKLADFSRKSLLTPDYGVLKKNRSDQAFFVLSYYMCTCIGHML